MCIAAPGKYRMCNGKIATITFVGKSILIGTREGWGPIMCFWYPDGRSSVHIDERQYDLLEKVIEAA